MTDKNEIVILIDENKIVILIGSGYGICSLFLYLCKSSQILL